MIARPSADECKPLHRYRLYRKLQPGPWFNTCASPAEYEWRYQLDVLDVLNARLLADELQHLAGGKTPVLCCYEGAGSGQWCHRALAARWLANALGIEVPEFGYESLEQNAHPLMAPELRRG
jgi:hypothetical protein